MDEGRRRTDRDRFWEGNFDVLVCTTIIESGIDMPTVNTLVVERADLLGLGQLHQIVVASAAVVRARMRISSTLVTSRCRRKRTNA